MKIWARYQTLPNIPKRSLLLVNKAVYVMTYPVLGKATSYTYTFQYTFDVDEREKAPKHVESQAPYVYVGSRPQRSPLRISLLIRLLIRFSGKFFEALTYTQNVEAPYVNFSGKNQPLTYTYTYTQSILYVEVTYKPLTQKYTQKFTYTFTYTKTYTFTQK